MRVAMLPTTTLSTTLFLVSILSVQSLGAQIPGAQELPSIWTRLDTNSPEYMSCLKGDCAPYLNVTSVCNVLANDGNFTVDNSAWKRNFLKCVCGSPQYLPGLQTCEQCIGNNTYSQRKSECDSRSDVSATVTTLLTTSTTTVTTSASGSASPSTTESPTTTNSTTQTKTTTTLTPTNTNSAGVSLVLDLWAGNAGYVLTGSLFGAAAVLAGVF